MYTLLSIKFNCEEKYSAHPPPINPFSKIITLPLFLVIPALIYFKKDKSFVRFIKDILVNRDTVILFFMINFLMIFYSIFNSFNIMYLITNNIIYISFYFFHILTFCHMTSIFFGTISFT